MKRSVLGSRVSIWIVVAYSFSSITNGYVIPERDCREHSDGPFYFKRLDETHYQCVFGGPVFTCPETFSIPDWYQFDDTQPCLCSTIVTEFNQTTRVCPQDPWVGQRTTEDPISATPLPGSINDNGCPSPFRKFEGLKLNSSVDEKEFELSPALGFLTPDDECKYHCLSIGTCTGVTFSLVDGEPQCIGYFASRFDYQLSDNHTYYEKVWCINQRPPFTLTPPAIQTGLVLANTRQGVDDLQQVALLLNVDELSCYSWCVYESSCAAVDYNKLTRTCYYHTATSCDAHAPAIDHCCNHYKKNISFC